MDFQLLIQDNQRDDNYVSATKLCKAFNKDLKHWRRADHTNEYIEALENHLNRFTPNGVKVSVIQTRRGVGTFIHPLLAIHLAEWLSPDFSVFVKQTFKSFLEADVELTTNLIARTESLEDIEKIQEKSEVQRQYLRSEFALNYESEKISSKHNAPWFAGRVKGYNNDCVGVEDGQRPAMQDNDKATLMFIQLAQAKKLERDRKSDNPYLAAGEAKTDCYKIAKDAHEIMYGTDAPKPRDFHRMKPYDIQKLGFNS